MKNVIDCYLNQKDILRLTYNEHGLQNLRTFGRANTKIVVFPIETHIHRSCMEIVIVIKGKQTYLSDDKQYSLSGGDVFISFVDQPHGSGNNPQEINEIIWFQIDMRYRKGFLGLNDKLGKILHTKLLSIKEPILKIDNESIKILKDAFAYFSGNEHDDIQNGQCLFISFLNRLVKAAKNKSAQDLSEDEQIGAVLAYIDTHLDECLNTHTLSKICFLSESRFKHKFVEQTGVTPTYYINSKRVEAAKRMLSFSKLSINDIAFKIGYNSGNYFSAVFAKYTGITPSQFRIRYKTTQKE